jgi:gas vesicle protein
MNTFLLWFITIIILLPVLVLTINGLKVIIRPNSSKEFKELLSDHQKLKHVVYDIKQEQEFHGVSINDNGQKLRKTEQDIIDKCGQFIDSHFEKIEENYQELENKVNDINLFSQV